MKASQEKEKGFALGNFYLESPNSERANRKKKVGLVVKREGWYCKKKKKKTHLGVQTSWRKVTGTRGAERAWNNAHFGVLQIKGELRRISAPGRCQGASVGTGRREGWEEALDSGLECHWAPA